MPTPQTPIDVLSKYKADMLRSKEEVDKCKALEMGAMAGRFWTGFNSFKTVVPVGLKIKEQGSSMLSPSDLPSLDANSKYRLAQHFEAWRLDQVSSSPQLLALYAESFGNVVEIWFYGVQTCASSLLGEPRDLDDRRLLEEIAKAVECPASGTLPLPEVTAELPPTRS